MSTPLSAGQSAVRPVGCGARKLPPIWDLALWSFGLARELNALGTSSFLIMRSREMKHWIYGLAVICFILAGTLDIKQMNYKEGVLAILYGIANAIIFFWRKGNA